MTEVHLDERALAKKYGLRELAWPESEQVKVLAHFLGTSLETGRCTAVPKTAIMLMLDFFQATVNRQHITKGPRMSQQEFDQLQTPYYLAARVIGKIAREKRESLEKKGKLYQTTYVTITQFIELLRSLLDPGCYWMRMKSIPEGVQEVMEVLWDFVQLYPEVRKKGRAM